MLEMSKLNILLSKKSREKRQNEPKQTRQREKNYKGQN